MSVARSKSRDARRLADIRQIATALEMYKDTNGDYPSANSIGNPWNADSFNYNAWISLNQYLSRYFENGVMPKDPKNDSSYSYRYEITPDHSLATLTYSLENDNPNLLDTPSFYSNSVRYYIKAMYR